METKACIKCGKELSLSNFDKAPANKDGLNNQCKECNAKYKKEWYKKNKKNISVQRKAYRDAHKEEKAEYDKEYRTVNRKRITEYQRQYYDENREAILEQHKTYQYDKGKALASGKKWRDNNKEYMSYLTKRWAQNNKDRVNVKTNRRRAKIRSLPNSFTPEQWAQAKQHFNNRCCYCGEKLPLEQEHFVPVIKGGGYSADNILPSCRRCNAQKNDKDFFEWYAFQEFYSPMRENRIIKYLELNENEAVRSMKGGG